jgi:hypothetical protein
VRKIEEVVGHLGEALLPLIPSKKRANSKRIGSAGVTGACRCGIGPVPLQDKIF